MNTFVGTQFATTKVTGADGVQYDAPVWYDMELTAYKGTEHECRVHVEVIEYRHLSFGFRLKYSNGYGYEHIGGSRSPLDAQARALLRAAAVGNGGFPLDNEYRSDRS